MSGPEAAPGEDAGTTTADPPGGTDRESQEAEEHPESRESEEPRALTVEEAIPDEGAVVLFDGVCNLCSGVVQFVIPRDPEGRLRFASLQSEAAEPLLDECDHDGGLDSVVLLTEDGCYTKSEAILRLSTYLKRPWPLFSAFRVLPTVLRDAVYDFVAGSRYRVFGKKDQCMVPSEDIRSRFLEDPTPSE